MDNLSLRFIYDIQKGKTKKLSHSMIDRVISVFPEFNKTWLLTGEGEMLKNQKPIIWQRK